MRPIDAVQVLNDINWHHKPTPVSEFESGFNRGLNQAMWIITHAPTLTPPNEPRVINADKLAKRIAGHSNYHGDSILAAIYCAAEGKENDAPIRPIETPPNEWVSVEDTVPDPGERVLATDGIFVGEAYRSSANSWFRHTGFPWRDGVTGRTVRFWMPLPAPPTNEE